MRGKAIALMVSSVVLIFYAFVNSMDVLLGFEATPDFIRAFAKGEADRVKVERKAVHRYGPSVRDLPRGRSLMVLEVTSEVELTRRLDITCDMTDPGGHVDGYVRKTVDPDDLPGGIPADTPVALEIDFPDRYSPYGPCKVIEAR